MSSGSCRHVIGLIVSQVSGPGKCLYTMDLCAFMDLRISEQPIGLVENKNSVY